MSDRLRDYCPQLREEQVEKQRMRETKQYADLPAAVRHDFSGKEWMWMSDQRKATLLQTETEPEWNE